MWTKKGSTPLLTVVDTFLRKRCKVGTPQMRQGGRPHALPVPPESLSRPPEALFCSPEPQLTTTRPCEGVEVAPQTWHVVTHLASSEGCQIYTVFSKKCQKRSKRGYPPFWSTFWEPSALPGTPTSDCALGGRFPGGNPVLRAEFLGWGVLVGRQVQKTPHVNGGGYTSPPP